MGHYVVDEESIANLEAEVSSYKKELVLWEDDYKLLVDNAENLAKAKATCGNSIYLTKCIKASTEEIINMSREVTITGFDKLFNFLGVEDSIEAANISNENYQEMLMEVGAKIDELKETIGERVKELTDIIYKYDTTINHLRNHPTLVEDD